MFGCIVGPSDSGRAESQGRTNMSLFHPLAQLIWLVLVCQRIVGAEIVGWWVVCSPHPQPSRERGTHPIEYRLRNGEKGNSRLEAIEQFQHIHITHA